MLSLFNRPKKEIIYSKNKMADLLPAGSVIKIKDNPKLFMIYDYRGGKKSKDIINQIIEVDYWCIDYPIGFLPDNQEIPVMQEEISEILFKGYESPLGKEFCRDLDKIQEVKK